LNEPTNDSLIRIVQYYMTTEQRAVESMQF